MSRDGLIICVLLAINFVVALVCLVYSVLRKRSKQGIAMFVLMLAFPIVAPVMIGIGNIARIIWKSFGVREINYEELTFSKKRMHLMAPADIKKSLNTVAVEEALIESDLKDRRRVFVDVLKDNDDEDVMPLIRKSVENTDSEVAHYAASFVASSVVAFKEQEGKYYQDLENEFTVQGAQRYIRHIGKMTFSGFVSQLEMAAYVDRLVQVAESFYAQAQDRMRDEDIQTVVRILETMGREAELRVWINRAHLRVWTSLVCFKLCANYYFKANDRDALFTLIEESKRHSLFMDKEAVEWVRLFETGGL